MMKTLILSSLLLSLVAASGLSREATLGVAVVLPVNESITEAQSRGKTDFGAYYTRLPVAGNDMEKVGDYADIVVQVGTNKTFIFARDSSYLPCLVAGNQKTYVEELVERKGDGTAARPDKINRYSYVRLIESTPEKVVVHWRYIRDFSYVQWDGVVDEYYTIDPAGNVERVVRVGTPKKKDWDDPSNRHIQIFRLTESGIQYIKNTAAALSRSKGAAIKGSKVLKGIVGKPAAEFMFDEGLKPNDDLTAEMVSRSECPVDGHQTVWRDGVSGSCLLFDGYYSKVTLPKEKAPSVKDKLTVEAWVSLGAYPFNWAPIVHHSTWEEKGYYLGVDSYGHLAFMANVGGTWRKVQASKGTFETDIELLRWYHVAATYDGSVLRLYKNGKEVASEPASGRISLPDRDLVIGLNTDKQTPTSPIRTWCTYPSIFGIDGLIDEVRIHTTALSAEDMAASFKNFSPSEKVMSKPDLEAFTLPADPKGKKADSFGASYENLHFHAGFDNLWRVGDHPDIVVKFDKSPCRVVFWKGLRYAPALVTENGKWSGDQSCETAENWGKKLPFDYPDSVGCSEHMSDAQARHSHVRIIESTPARVVIHWRYAEIDVRYTLTHDKDGWGDWADEYYTIYPDGVAIRNIARGAGGWQETIFYNAPGTKPEDNVAMDAYTLVNAAGEERTYSWDEAPRPYPSIPGDLNIKEGGPLVSMVNFKSAYRAYYIYAERSGVSTFNVEVRPEFSRFPWWNHYPVSQAISDGRSAERADRMTSSSLVWGKPTKGCLMIGLTDQPAASLVPLAKSWDSAPAIDNFKGCTLDSKGCTEGYSQRERAYKLCATGSEISFDLKGAEGHPIVNPCFVIRNWGGREDAVIHLEGARSKDIRQGIVIDTSGSFVKIIWLAVDETRHTVRFTITKR